MRQRYRISGRTGMTLPEVMVAMVVFVILCGGIVMIFSAYSDFWNSHRTRIQLQQDLRLSMAWIASELRQTGGGAIDLPVNATGAQLTFQKRTKTGETPGWSVSSVQYMRGGTNNRQLLRVQGGQSRIIANNVVGLSFTRTSAAPDILTVALSVNDARLGARMAPQQLTFGVQLRN